MPPVGIFDDPEASTASPPVPAGRRIAPLKAADPDQGPCLYLGPGGERCFRRAARDGYCSVHLPPKPSALASPSDGVAADKPKTRTVKIISALAALLGFLAPMLDNIVRAILRWLHSH